MNTYPRISALSRSKKVLALVALAFAACTSSVIASSIPYKMLNGLEPLRVPEPSPNQETSYIIQLQAGNAATADYPDTRLIEFTSAYNIDIRVYGAGGRDYSGAAQTGWHYVWLLYSTTTLQSAAIMSLSELGGGVMIPAGYDRIRKLKSFAFYYDALSSDKIRRYVFTGWPSPMIYYTAADNGTPYRALLDSSATSWTRLDLGNLVPKSARIARLHCHVEYAGASGSAYVRVPGLGNGLIVGSVSPYMTSQREAIVDLAMSSANEIDYKTSAGVQLSLYVIAFSIQETY